MNTKKINKLDIEIIFLSFFWSGFVPFAPGTFASALTLPILYFLGSFNAPFILFIPFLIIATTFSCLIAEIVQKKYGLHDPGWIVMDEVLGMLTTWLFYRGNDLRMLFLIFVLFRIFDIFKVWPASYFDKKVTHGAGTIIDDIISGVFAGLVFLLISNYI